MPTPESETTGGNWWGEPSPFAVSMASPLDGARRVLIDACAAQGHLDADGEPLDDRLLFRRARIHTHPDHRDGDRDEWDLVEKAARVLGLIEDPEKAPRGRRR